MKSSIVSSTVLSCSLFSCLTFPLVAFGSQPLQIEFQKESIFEGTLKDVASPYLGFAALASFGVGAVSLSINEWRKSSRKQATAQAAVSQLQRELKHKETQLEELQLSDSLLKASGYHGFLESEFTPTSAVPMSVVTEETAPAPEVRMVPPSLPGDAVSHSRTPARPPLPAVAPQTAAAPALADTQPVAPTAPQRVPARAVAAPHATPMPVHSAESMIQPVVHAVVTPLPRGQAHLDRVAQQAAAEAVPVNVTVSSQPAMANPQTPAEVESANSATVAVLAQVNALQNQLRQMTTHVATLQSSLLTTVESEPSPTADSSTLVIEHLHRRLQRLESDWTRARAAS